MAGTLVLSPGFSKNAESVLLQREEALEWHKGVQCANCWTSTRRYNITTEHLSL